VGEDQGLDSNTAVVRFLLDDYMTRREGGPVTGGEG
jgi:hypothetical protein